MSEQEHAPVAVLCPIPDHLRSEETGELIDKCVVCEKYLLDQDTSYMIEKAFKRYEKLEAEFVIFEYAICLACAETMRREISAESLQKMDTYFKNSTNWSDRWQKLTEGDASWDESKWIDRCVIKATPSEELQEYQLCAQCSGRNMVLSDMPFLIGAAAMDEIADLLSEKTLGEMDDFVDRFLGLPPEWKEALKDRDIVLF